MRFLIKGTWSSAPALALYGNAWALQELPKEASSFWTRQEILIELRAAGFDGMQAPLDWADEVRTAGLRFATDSRVNTAAEIWNLAGQARQAGADFATLHVGWGAETDTEMDTLAKAILGASEQHCIPLWPETHRATMLQDCWRTLQLLKRFPALRLNFDLSHYYCGGEAPYRGFQENRKLWLPLLAKVACFHGRISNGQVMQIPAADPYYAEHVKNFHDIWREAMQSWRASAGDHAVLPFIPELGPPSSGYALTVVTPDEGRTEVTDRWAEMRTMAETALELFAQVSRSSSDRQCSGVH